MSPWGGVDKLLSEFQGYLDEKHIPYKDVCIVGSFVLHIYGIREAGDLDFIVSSKYAGQFPCKAVKVTEGKRIEKVSRQWLRVGKNVILSDDEIINDPGLYFIYRGFKVAKMPLVVYKKGIARREKDMNDLRMLLDRSPVNNGQF